MASSESMFIPHECTNSFCRSESCDHEALNLTYTMSKVIVVTGKRYCFGFRSQVHLSGRRERWHRLRTRSTSCAERPHSVSCVKE